MQILESKKKKKETSEQTNCTLGCIWIHCKCHSHLWSVYCFIKIYYQFGNRRCFVSNMFYLSQTVTNSHIAACWNFLSRRREKRRQCYIFSFCVVKRPYSPRRTAYHKDHVCLGYDIEMWYSHMNKTNTWQQLIFGRIWVGSIITQGQAGPQYERRDVSPATRGLSWTRDCMSATCCHSCSLWAFLYILECPKKRRHHSVNSLQ